MIYFKSAEKELVFRVLGMGKSLLLKSKHEGGVNLNASNCARPQNQPICKKSSLKRKGNAKQNDVS